MDDCDRRRRELVRPSSGAEALRDAESLRHRSISMVEEPTKTLRGALAFFRGASCQILTRTIANPAIRSAFDRMMDFATP
jgi:hypothetical protein